MTGKNGRISENLAKIPIAILPDKCYYEKGSFPISHPLGPYGTPYGSFFAQNIEFGQDAECRTWTGRGTQNVAGRGVQNVDRTQKDVKKDPIVWSPFLSASVPAGSFQFALS